ncbi:hypothetical protein E2C01_001573 [Portunus trituberculatus]|uniref:Uncharacterized protein n=1 Tax=Portunus trituberculatus TaxID=210409 RepID=A0A5B7CJR8_PORTR|nr:hypothetical protein [Portunus trituberculatus]
MHHMSPQSHIYEFATTQQKVVETKRWARLQRDRGFDGGVWEEPLLPECCCTMTFVSFSVHTQHRRHIISKQDNKIAWTTNGWKLNSASHTLFKCAYRRYSPYRKKVRLNMPTATPFSLRQTNHQWAMLSDN